MPLTCTWKLRLNDVLLLTIVIVHGLARRNEMGWDGMGREEGREKIFPPPKGCVRGVRHATGRGGCHVEGQEGFGGVF